MTTDSRKSIARELEEQQRSGDHGDSIVLSGFATNSLEERWQKGLPEGWDSIPSLPLASSSKPACVSECISLSDQGSPIDRASVNSERRSDESSRSTSPVAATPTDGLPSPHRPILPSILSPTHPVPSSVPATAGMPCPRGLKEDGGYQRFELWAHARRETRPGRCGPTTPRKSQGPFPSGASFGPFAPQPKRGKAWNPEGPSRESWDSDSIWLH